MKALSLTQPWASLIAIGAKRIETRSWSTTYRGPIAIHAARSMPPECREVAYLPPACHVLTDAGILLGAADCGLPRGAIIALATLTGIARTENILAMSQGLLRHEIEFGDYSPHRFGWLLADVRPLPEPILCRGALGLWTVPADVVTRLMVPA